MQEEWIFAPSPPQAPTSHLQAKPVTNATRVGTLTGGGGGNKDSGKRSTVNDPIIRPRVLATVLSHDTSLQACPVPSISPYLGVCRRPPRRHVPTDHAPDHVAVCLVSRPHRSAGSGASSVPATTIRRASRFLVSHAKAMVDST
jgi:hypothetical protein